jgi:hypothetical protein
VSSEHRDDLTAMAQTPEALDKLRRIVSQYTLTTVFIHRIFISFSLSLCRSLNLSV